MHGQCGKRAEAEHEQIQIDGDLMRIEDGHERHRREAADERGARKLQRDRSTRSRTPMACVEMTVAFGAGRQL